MSKFKSYEQLFESESETYEFWLIKPFATFLKKLDEYVKRELKRQLILDKKQPNQPKVAIRTNHSGQGKNGIGFYSLYPVYRFTFKEAEEFLTRILDQKQFILVTPPEKFTSSSQLRETETAKHDIVFKLINNKFTSSVDSMPELDLTDYRGRLLSKNYGL